MRKIAAIVLVCLLSTVTSFAKGDKDSLQASLKMLLFADSVNGAMKYETGLVKLQNGIASLNVPKQFKFLNAEQSKFVITKVWGNPEQKGVLGMLFPENGAPFADSNYAFVITYDEIGYVKDEDADEIDYKKMLKESQDEEPEVNKERAAQGFEPIHMIGWAQQPFYDKNKKVLHWAKELQFGSTDNSPILNYDIRVLGRKGVLSFNAVADMSELGLVKRDIDKVLAMSSFTEGNRYSDFDSNLDKVAAYTIGGLVAGKILLKVGFWAILAKFAKVIIGGLVAAFYAVRKFLTGRGKKEETMVTEEEPIEETEETTV